MAFTLFPLDFQAKASRYLISQNMQNVCVESLLNLIIRGLNLMINV